MIEHLKTVLFYLNSTINYPDFASVSARLRDWCLEFIKNGKLNEKRIKWHKYTEKQYAIEHYQSHNISFLFCNVYRI